MSANPADDHPGQWRAPGTEPADSPQVAALLARLETVLDEVAELPLTALSDADVTRLVDGATAASSRVTRQLCRAVSQADDRRLGDEIGARHTHQWWARRSNLTAGEARRLVSLGRDLERDLHTPTGAALGAGTLRTDQAAVIIAAVDAIPAKVETSDGVVRILGSGIRTQARDHLLTAARQHDAKALRRLGKRVLDVVAPEVGEAHEQRLLEDEERRAVASARFSAVDDGHGRLHGRFCLPSHQGAMLMTALHALANPARHDSTKLTDPATGTFRPTPERLGQAFGEWIERYPVDRLPQAAGVNATIVVTLDLDTLLTGVGAATLGNGDRVSAGTARRLACEAGIIPAVLGGASVPLDLGRSKRLHSRPQRIALALRDRGCTAQGCDMPPDACHAHHDLEWSAQRGPTDVQNGRLLCPHHHRRAHDSRYEKRVGPDNVVSFHRRT